MVDLRHTILFELQRIRKAKLPGRGSDPDVMLSICNYMSRFDPVYYKDGISNGSLKEEKNGDGTLVVGGLISDGLKHHIKFTSMYHADNVEFLGTKSKPLYEELRLEKPDKTISYRKINGADTGTFMENVFIRTNVLSEEAVKIIISEARDLIG